MFAELWIVLSVAASALASPPVLPDALVERSAVRATGAEIVSYSAPDGVLVVAGAGVVRAFRWDDGWEALWSAPARALVPEFGLVGAVTHVAVDPQGRGFFVALVAPEAAWSRTGRAVIGDIATGTIVSRHEVGYGPDACAFSEDGGTIIIANEGEAGVSASGAVVDPPGSISILRVGEDLAITRAVLPAREGVTGEVRIHPRNAGAPTLDLEPEYVAVLGRRVYVSLQENNAVAEIDLRSGETVRVVGMGSALVVVDTDDGDGVAGVHSHVRALAMPDQIAAFEANGRRYVVTANEGDDRGEWGESTLGDSARLGALRESGRLSGNVTLGSRLKVCAFSGDTDGDGVIDQPCAMGTRSLSVWDAQSWRRVGDTGSGFELAMSKHPAIYNATGGDALVPDSRSDDRGPEPEGLTLTELDGRRLAFVGLERPGAIAVVDLSEPERPAMVALHPSALGGRFAPEGLAFVRGADSPTGVPLLLVAYEVSGEVVTYEIAVGDIPLR